MTKTELFLKLAKPNKDGVSRWVSVSEFVGEYADLTFGNGASWARKESTLAKNYLIEFDKSKTPGNSIDAIRLAGKNDGDYSQHINAAIKRTIKAQRCVVLGTSKPEVDHKNGMKNEDRVMRNEDQKLSDFQPLSKAANDAKRQYCKECRNFPNERLNYPSFRSTTGNRFGCPCIPAIFPSLNHYTLTSYPSLIKQCKYSVVESAAMFLFSSLSALNRRYSLV